MFFEYRACIIELLCSYKYYKWDAYIYFPDGDNQFVGDDFDSINAAKFAAIKLIEKERLLHLQDPPQYYM